MDAFLSGGGNLIVFPEGTRSRDGSIGAFNKGAFKIAQRCRAPIKVLYVSNTDRMFRCGSFSFATRGLNTIRLELIGEVAAPDPGGKSALRLVMDRVREMIESQQIPMQIG
jgi:1-acyl-sn-glycerol-3-phosphate acyltransferase